MPFPLIQSNFATSASSQNQAGTMASAMNVADLNMAFVMCFQATAATLNSVTDTAGNVYTLILGPIVSGSTQLWLLYNGGVKAFAAGNVITANFSAVVTSPVIGWAEFGGGPGTIQSNSATGTGTAMTASVTSPNINGISVGWFGNGSSAITAAGGSTQLFTGAASGFAAQYKNVSGTGGKIQTANNAASVTWAEVMAAFPAAPLRFGSSGIGFSPVYKAVATY